jgi:hypothetical protein
VGAEDDHDVVDGAAAHPLQHRFDQEPLLG